MLPQRITSRPRDVKHHGFYAPIQSIILFKFIFTNQIALEAICWHYNSKTNKTLISVELVIE